MGILPVGNKPITPNPFKDSPILQKWVNGTYLEPDNISAIRQATLAKPFVHYAVLDNFLNTYMLDQLITKHQTLEFSAEQDRRGATGEWLPYDGEVHFATAQDFGSELFRCPIWHEYLKLLSGCDGNVSGIEVKLRWHRAEADGFWIHTDSTIRMMVAILYFNKGWTAADGGLLQLWVPLPATMPPDMVVPMDHPEGRMEFLRTAKIIRSSMPGGGIDGLTDFLLLDQIVPVYNRLFLCDFLYSPAYHSVTPSNGKERTGFVQWLIGDHNGDQRRAKQNRKIQRSS